MANQSILIIPDPVLKTASTPISAVTRETRRLLDDMLETMYVAPGIGLAAVQIGVLQRALVLDVAREEEEADPLCMINPEIIWRSEDVSEYEEGCLSIPEVYETVTRPSEVNVRYLDRNGKPCEIHCTGLKSTCVQHEIDHLDGVLFIDYLTRLKRDRIVKKFVKSKQKKDVA